MFIEESTRPSFELFKSTTCHKLKEMGDIPFITNLLENNRIRTYYEKQWYPESLYLLAMLDHLSKLHSIPLCSNYNDLRKAASAPLPFRGSAYVRAAAFGFPKRGSTQQGDPRIPAVQYRGV